MSVGIEIKRVIGKMADGGVTLLMSVEIEKNKRSRKQWNRAEQSLYA